MALAHALRTLVMAAALVVVAATAASAQGKIEVEGGPAYDWGRVGPGQLKATIAVKNVGDAPLKISDVRPSCGCTVAPIDKNLLQPGEIGKISVTMNASGFGPVKKSLTVSSDDPVNPSQVIFLSADIRPVMTYEPADYFLVNNAQVGVPMATSLTIVNRSEEPITFQPPALVTANVKIVFAMTEPVTVKAGEKLELKAEVTPLKSGPVNGEVRVKTSTKEKPELVFNIWGNVADLTPVATPAPAAH